MIKFNIPKEYNIDDIFSAISEALSNSKVDYDVDLNADPQIPIKECKKSCNKNKKCSANCKGEEFSKKFHELTNLVVKINEDIRKINDKMIELGSSQLF